MNPGTNSDDDSKATEQPELAKARLRLAMRCLLGAAEVDMSLFETNELQAAIAAVASLLGQ